MNLTEQELRLMERIARQKSKCDFVSPLPKITSGGEVIQSKNPKD